MLLFLDELAKICNRDMIDWSILETHRTKIKVAFELLLTVYCLNASCKQFLREKL